MQRIPMGTRTLVERYTPLFEVTSEGHVARTAGGVAKYVIPSGVKGELRSTDEFQSQKINYIVLGNDSNRRAAEPQHYASAIARYEYILAYWPLMYEARARSLLGCAGLLRVPRTSSLAKADTAAPAELIRPPPS